MKNALTTDYLELLSSIHGAKIAEAVISSDPATFAGRVPSTWLDLVRQPGEQTMRAVWDQAANHLPRFIGYLAKSIEGAAIVEVHEFPVLLLALPDWREEPDGLSPGFCWMGTPAATASIERLIADVGPIPPSLEHLWRIANFITIKERSILCSLEPAAYAMTERPLVLPTLADSNAPQDVYECLQIAVVNDQMVTCVTRRPGESRWADCLVGYFRRTGQLAPAVRTRLDDKLADWTFTDWTS